jgi:hypothetical protein
MNEDLVKAIVEGATKEQPGDTDYSLQARKAAARKMMTALKSDDEDMFITALSELKDIDE